MQNGTGETRAIMIGHLYPVMEHNPRILERLQKKIKNLNPHYIFILGDSKLFDPIVIKNWRKKFGDKVFFAPGNNEVIKGNLDIFFNSVGYTETFVDTNNVRYLITNSNDNAENLINFIKNSSQDLGDKKLILLTHHRIWDDTLTSARPYEHDKSYYLKDIFPILEKYVDEIFAGNSKHQYFFDEKRGTGNQNMNNIFWVDRIGDINAYSIGTGIGRPKLGFVEVISKKKKPTIVIPHHLNTDEYIDPIPLNKQIKLKGSIPPINTKKNLFIKNRNYNIKDKLLILIYPWRRYIERTLFFITGILFTLLILGLFYKKIKLSFKIFGK